MQVNISKNTSLRCASDPNYPEVITCFENPQTIIIFITFSLTSLLFLLPLYVLILWMGFRRWRRRSSVTASHTDVITFYMVAIEIFGVLGSVIYSAAILACSTSMMTAGYYSLTLTYPGQTFLHCLTCLERYLAVVHPVTYLGLRQSGGVKLRNISIGCVWLLCFGTTALTALTFPNFPSSIFYSIYTCTLSVVTFCSFSALRVLIRLGPGKAERERIDQSKRRAVYTIVIITGTLMMRFSGLLISNIISDFNKRLGNSGCDALMVGFWLCLPSSLVLPLLFLHRAGKLTCCSRNTNNSKN